MPTIELAEVTHTLGGRVRVAKIAFLSTPATAPAHVRLAKVGFLTPAPDPATVHLAKVGFLVRDAYDGTSLLREFDGERWQPITGQLVTFDGTSWAPA